MLNGFTFLLFEFNLKAFGRVERKYGNMGGVGLFECRTIVRLRGYNGFEDNDSCCGCACAVGLPS